MHTVYLDMDTHYLVIADYTQSGRHKALPEDQWKLEFHTDSAYLSMREKSPNAVAGVTPKGIGRWLKDWSGPYRKTALSIVCGSTPDFDAVPHQPADGVAVHKVIVKKIGADGTPASGSDLIRGLSSSPVPMSLSKFNLENGVAEISIGPCACPCNFTLEVVDPTDKMTRASLKLRFS